MHSFIGDTDCVAPFMMTSDCPAISVFSKYKHRMASTNSIVLAQVTAWGVYRLTVVRRVLLNSAPRLRSAYYLGSYLCNVLFRFFFSRD